VAGVVRDDAVAGKKRRIDAAISRRDAAPRSIVGPSNVVDWRYRFLAACA
jgi:hypothetical protein